MQTKIEQVIEWLALIREDYTEVEIGCGSQLRTNAKPDRTYRRKTRSGMRDVQEIATCVGCAVDASVRQLKQVLKEIEDADPRRN